MTNCELRHMFATKLSITIKHVQQSDNLYEKVSITLVMIFDVHLYNIDTCIKIYVCVCL